MITNPVKAIRAKCLDCCCGSSHEVSLCSCSDCPLYPFRFGKNPYRTPRIYTEKQLEAARERMKLLNGRSPDPNPSSSPEENNISPSEGSYTPETQNAEKPYPSA